MATITLSGTGEVVHASPALSILNNLLRNGTPISHICGGKAQCGTCRFRILEGARYLSPKSPREIQKLAALKNPPDTRLACQTYTYGDITIEIVFPKPPV